MGPYVRALQISPLRRAAAVAVCAGCAVGPALAVDEADLKAAIVYNLLAFIDWPPAAAPRPNAELVLCVSAASSLLPPLKQLAGKPLRGGRLAVREWQPGPSAAPCHALALRSTAELAGPDVAAALRAASVAVFTESARSDGDPAVVYLDIVGGKVRFELDVGNAGRAGLRLSAKLMHLARRIHE